MADEQWIDNIVHKAERAVQNVISNHIKPETCREKKEKAKWAKEKVVRELIVKLTSSVGPSEVKG